jgi:uncharacterized protein (TIGR02099 family)
VRAILFSIAKKTAYVLAILLVMVALLLTASRFIRPVLNEYRPDIEKMARELLAVPVTVGEVVVTWHQYQPGINLKRVTLYDKEGKHPTFSVEKVGIFFSIPKSLWHWKPVPVGLMVSGADINLKQNAKGEIEAQGIPTVGGQPLQGEAKMTDLLQWLAQQPRLILRDIDIHYTPNKGQKRFVTLYDLSFHNTDANHIILGKAILHQAMSTDVTIAVQWKGTEVDLEKIRAKIYVYVSGVSFPQWLSTYSWNNWQVTQGIGSAKIWATWNHGAFKRIQSTLQMYDVALYSQTDKSTHTVHRLSGNVGWRRQGDIQTIAADDILIDLPSHLWPVTSFSVTLSKDASGALSAKTANMGYVDLADFQSFLFSSPAVFSETTKKMLKGLQLQGELQNAAMVFSGNVSDWSKLSFNANVSRLRISPWQKLPGVGNLSGTVKWNGSQGSLSLHSNQANFQYQSIFVNDIVAEQLTGELQWHMDGDHAWVLSTPGLQILNNDFAANVSGSLTIPEKGQVVADIKSNFSLLKASHVTRYLPLHIFEPNLVEWLQEAFLSGEVKAGNAVFAGPVADFPFDKQNGKFEISAQLNNVDFRYAPDWPILQQIKGKILFAGRRIVIDVDSAKTLSVPIGKVHAEIPYLGAEKPQVLTVEPTELQTDFAQALAYVHASPLEKTIGKMFADMEASGPVIIKLGLIVPLADPDKTQVKGAVVLKNADVNLVPWQLALNKLNGTVNFTEKTTDADNIKGLLFNQPLQFSLATIEKSKTLSIVRASFTNHLNMNDLEAWLKVPFSKVVTGATDVAGELDFSLKTPVEVHLRTNLVGIALDLPNEYAKKADEAKPLKIDIILQEKQPLKLKTFYEDKLSAALILNKVRDEFKLIGINLRLGGGDPAWPEESGFYISGTIPLLDWDKVKEYTGQTDNKLLANYPLRGIDVEVARLMLPGQELSNVRLQVTPEKNTWDIDITSSDIVGEIKAPVNFNAKGAVIARFDKLSLHTGGATKQNQPPIVVKSLPSISLVANNVTYNGLPLGQVSLKTTPSARGAVIQSLRIASPRVDFQASGDWTQSGTQLQGRATSTRVSDLLNSLGIARNLIASKGEVNFTLNWHGPFFAPALASLSGHITLRLGSGRIVDIGEESDAKMGLGRMLSIFSLQTIPRRLSLDFSDLFQKGYSFDSVTGEYSLKNGNAFTNNMRLTGPVAQVDISGRIGLSSQDYDFTLSVTPVDVTSSLPVAATLITGPVGGLAALAVNTVVGSQIAKAATSYFSVRGPWSHPTWETVKTGRGR